MRLHGMHIALGAAVALVAWQIAMANTLTITCIPAIGDTFTGFKLYKPLGVSAAPATDQVLETNATGKFLRTDVWNGTFRHYCTVVNGIAESDPSPIQATTVGPKPDVKPKAPTMTVVSQ